MMSSKSVKKLDLSLYLITKPYSQAKGDYLRILEKALKGGVSLLQWREKEGDTGALYRLAKEAQTLAKEYQTPFLINDRLDLVLALEADGLHVGQKDLPAKLARQLLGPKKLLGVSAGDLSEALQAEEDGADYIGVGSIFPTSSKKDATPLSIEALKGICQAVTIPVVAIGGMTLDRLPFLKESGIQGVAVLSSVWDHECPTKAVQDLKQVMMTLR